MDDQRAWHFLPASHPDVPPLLVSAIFGPSSYSVHISDLATVWSESLGRREICMRGFQENTTIDPSYDDEQMAVFLGKIGAAFEALSGDRPDSRLALSPGPDGDLLLQITSILPQGLEPLRWPMRLKRGPSSAVSQELVLPLIQERSMRLHETDLLLTALQDKDAIISKLVDKLEAMGVGLESVFPSLAGRRKVGRSGVEDRVKGLAPFNETHIRRQLNSLAGNDEPWSVDRIVKDGIGMRELKRDTAITADDSLGDWWKNLRTGTGTVLSPVNDNRFAAREEESPVVDSAILPVREESFETQNNISPNRTKRKESPAPISTTGTAESLPQRRVKSGAGRLGAIGKKGSYGEQALSSQSAKSAEEKTETSAPSHPVVTTTKAAVVSLSEPDPAPAPEDTGAGGAETVSGMGGNRSSSKRSTSPEEQVVVSPKSKPAKRGLGKIGKIGNTRPSETVPPPIIDQETSTGGKLPGIERKAGKSGSSPAHQSTLAEETKTKRDENLQQTVAKHAAPVRKKRKF